MYSANLFRCLWPAVAAIMFDLLEKIQHSTFPPISFLSKSEWNILVNCTASDLKVSSAEVIDVEYKDEIPSIQHYLVATSTKIRA